MTPEDQQKADELAKSIRALAHIFIGRVPSMLSSMNDELNLIDLDPQNQMPWKTLHRHLHTIAGTAGTFGYSELGDRARALEHRINDMLKDSTVPSEAIKSTFIRDQRNFMAWVVQHTSPE